MEFLKDITLYKGDKTEVTVEEALKGKEIIGFYFSAHWCPPCRIFTPILAKAYAEAMEENLPIEIIFATNDGSEEEMFSYMNELHGNWLALPHGTEAINQLSEKYNVSGIPTLIILKKDGTKITEDGQTPVEEKSGQAFKDWLK